jgi:hypothetical protein
VLRPYKKRFARIFGLLRFGHLGFDQADDDHDDGSADTASTDAGKNRRHIHAGAGSCGRHSGSGTTGSEHAEEMTTERSTDESCDGIANGTEVEILENRTGDVSSNSAANQLNDEGKHICFFSFDPCGVAERKRTNKHWSLVRADEEKRKRGPLRTRLYTRWEGMGRGNV